MKILKFAPSLIDRKFNNQKVYGCWEDFHKW